MTAIGTDSPAGPAIVLGRVRPAGKVERILRDEGIQFLFQAQTLNVQGRSGDSVSLTVRTPSGEQKIEGSDIFVAAGAFPTPPAAG
jgi:pyruvate/2-oxoglutarate dehydrogenase complex dihydrolipoamide dehydrogenase (E3) component